VQWRVVLAPNLTVEAALAALINVVDPNTALRLMVLAALLGFAVAAVLLVRAAGAPTWTAVLLLPVQTNTTVMLGLIGFAVAMVLAMLAVAAALRARGRPPVGLLLVLLVLCWFTHLIPAVAATGMVGAIELCRRLGSDDGSVTPRRFLAAAVSAVIALRLPIGAVVALSVGFLATGGTDGSSVSRIPGGGPRVLDLTKPLVVLVESEFWLARAYALALYVATAILVTVRWQRGRREGFRIEPADGLLLAALAIGAFSTIMPEDIGSVSYTATRTSVYFPLALAAWVASQVGSRGDPAARFPLRVDDPRTVVVAAAVIAALVAVALPLVRLTPMISLGEDLAEMRRLEPCLTPGSTVVQLNLHWGDDRAVRTLPMVDQIGTLAAERRLLDLSNISGQTSYYVWRFSDRADPEPVLSSGNQELSGVPPEVTLAAALAAGYPLDAVVVYGRRDAAPDILTDPRWILAQDDLLATFRRVAVTPTGVAELWVRRDATSPCG
jgi:hypothetical protein